MAFFVSIYLVVLSGVFLWFFLRLNRLIKDNDKQGFIKIFEDLIKKEKENIKAVESLRQEVRKNSEEGLAHFQKLGLIRFNPFNETGVIIVFLWLFWMEKIMVG